MTYCCQKYWYCYCNTFKIKYGYAICYCNTFSLSIVIKTRQPVRCSNINLILWHGVAKSIGIIVIFLKLSMDIATAITLSLSTIAIVFISIVYNPGRRFTTLYWASRLINPVDSRVRQKSSAEMVHLLIADTCFLSTCCWSRMCKRGRVSQSETTL